MRGQLNTNIHPAISFDELPSDVYMNFDAFNSNTVTREHAHIWGQLQFIRGGMLELFAEGTRFLAPPNLAIWVPAGVLHHSFNRKPLDYCSMNVSIEKTRHMPSHTCLLGVTPIMTAIIEDFRLRGVSSAETEQDKRLIDVLLDQLAMAPEKQHFLPTSSQKMLAPILRGLEEDPTNNLSLKEWASKVHTTERTLARHCQSELGMSFTEWRLRIRYLHSMELLRKGKSVKETAFMLGYNQASPFITMFKRYAGVTPDQYKGNARNDLSC
ncbi:putative Transcriptional regulator, AraC family [Vibrio nigripulchritudo MADA3029]|uniref:Putative Transcriptional regulator, AraC family n=2 Tax=Vibrio nigripulchritudo TaxID=28173 RepID=U4KCK7_9VIBR|nr:MULTISPECIES: helix-turn-helix transcriptional regulator [Vibrio]KJY74665.1 AraC family transcriptional regulator [Vibrio nigripulchritudo]UAB73996.1 helix-turn-helix transcriptional regulator [Vibrio sp. SCSIO 43132]CCN34683.1 putative Transcriptional regulator, AraC family [Vibrio nigripulchritudo AM115]CCN40018.1 putative Transcriptional regulator, AraC family [Vibrio nigripulchritudo FTn2]CCN45475.1 putative Transcriptional regulator, AraC family [Vibrio nigripulchritudo MADA3020]